ncbi:MAG: ADP-ribosylglycohydrolase family protein [Azonexus sp.]|nr:ADP-ribosylglycohydrolase family protein [Azonexus sp.]MCK6411650.1 ADP-ribosylglycohydrolase family protein [Azonexus sp.]
MGVTVNQIINSAKWAAYGDGLGFITELADASGVKRRAGVQAITKLLPWKRLVGGKFGTFVELPEGCYSDDTQLRLATSRAIRGSGEFDVEAFAKVEVPVWLSYALGAGRGTKIAATSLAKDNINWFSNFYDGASGHYVNGGGNGAAMRIQPHVWCARDNTDSCLQDVVRNSVCTHGHARGILGAVFHAVCLSQALESRTYPGPDQWEQAVRLFSRVPEIVRGDSALSTFWLPTWERLSATSLTDAVKNVQNECMKDIELVGSLSWNADPSLNYRELAERLGVLEETQRGSGTKTAILGSALSWLFQNDNPEHALLAAANLLGSDTDTIATMAGAIIGAVVKQSPSGRIADHEYIESEARRMHAIRIGAASSSFYYPDLLRWQPPRTQLDSVGKDGDSFYVAGLGRAKPVGSEMSGRSGDDTVWQWLRLDFGQTILAKRRKDPRATIAQNTPRQIGSRPKINSSSAEHQTDMLDSLGTGVNERKEAAKTLDTMTSEAIKSGFDPTLIGAQLLEIADRQNGVEQAIAYSAIIAKARAARGHRRG